MTNTIQISSRLQARLAITSEQLVDFRQRWEVAELVLFVSILRDYFHLYTDNVLIPKRKMVKGIYVQQIIALLKLEEWANESNNED